MVLYIAWKIFLKNDWLKAVIKYIVKELTSKDCLIAVIT